MPLNSGIRQSNCHFLLKSIHIQIGRNRLSIQDANIRSKSGCKGNTKIPSYLRLSKNSMICSRADSASTTPYRVTVTAEAADAYNTASFRSALSARAVPSAAVNVSPVPYLLFHSSSFHFSYILQNPRKNTASPATAPAAQSSARTNSPMTGRSGIFFSDRIKA